MENLESNLLTATAELTLTKEGENVTPEVGARNYEIFQLRPLTAYDHPGAYCQLLRQLTDAPDLSQEEFQAILATPGRLTCVVSAHRDLYHPILHPGKIIASGSLLVERKFIRKGALMGHIEDIVVDSGYQGQGWGAMIVRHLINKAQQMGCYKIILTCKEELVPFYQRCGFDHRLVTMAKYL